MQGIEPGRNPNALYFDDRRARTHVVESLLAQAEDLTLGISTLEIGVRNLTEATAERLLQLGIKSISKALALAMVDMEWQPGRIHRILRRSTEGLRHLDDQEVIEHLCQTEHGRSFLLLAKSSDTNIRTRVEGKVFEAVPKNSTATDWAILDHLHRAREIHLDNDALAHLWKEGKHRIYLVPQTSPPLRARSGSHGPHWRQNL